MFDKINDEIEKFERRAEASQDLRLFVDFNSLNISYEKNQIEIPVIKYKKKKSLKGSVVDLKKRKSSSNNLF